MDLLIILRDALASSVMGGMLAAIDAKQSGLSVGVLVTQEALAGLAGGTLAWPRELAPQGVRFPMCDRAAQLGVPVAGSGQGRRLDARATVRQASEAGVALYACPLWSALLGLAAPPDGFTAIDRADLPKLLTNAKRVIGTL
ncbi:MAG: hypothetical protein U0610_31480 [bacterium]